MENIEMKSFRNILYVDEKEILEEKFKKANSKLTKMGIPQMTLRYFDGSEFSKDDEPWFYSQYEILNDLICGVEISYPTINNIAGEKVKYVGFADLEECSESNKQFYIEDEEDFQNIKTLDLCCYSCKKKIARNKYFYFKKECDNSYIALGRKCAKDYFPFDPSKLIGFMSEIFGVFDDSEKFQFKKVMKTISLEDLFCLSAVATNDFTKWEKSSDEYGNENPYSTTNSIRMMMSDLNF